MDILDDNITRVAFNCPVYLADTRHSRGTVVPTVVSTAV